MIINWYLIIHTFLSRLADMKKEHKKFRAKKMIKKVASAE